jgi:hypothetical protein
VERRVLKLNSKKGGVTMGDIWKRIIAVIIGIVLLVASIYGYLIAPQGDVARDWLPSVMVAAIAGINCLVGYIQPLVSWPALTSLMFSPGTWIGLFILCVAAKEWLLSGIKSVDTMGILMCIIFSWMNCFIGMHYKKRHLLRNMSTKSDTSEKGVK